MQWWRDSSPSTWVAGLVTVLVGFSSSIAIVFQAAQAAGANAAQTASWIWALGLCLGLSSFWLSAQYRIPVVTAWSTAGAVMLLGSSQGFSLAQVLGACLVSALLGAVAGFTGWQQRLMRRLPHALGAAMLAGVLFKFGLKLFEVLPQAPWLAGGMMLLYLLTQPWRQYRILLTLAISLIWVWGLGELPLAQLDWQLTRPVWVSPEWSWSAALSLGVPLWLVSSASQTLPGIGVLQAAGYSVPVSGILGRLGLMQLPFIPFGAFSLNTAAITATLCSGVQAHPDPARRYTAAMAAGLFYLLAGLFGASIVTLFSVLPSAWIWTMAGLALLGPLGHALQRALQVPDELDAALVTFLVTVSGLSWGGIHSAVWGLAAGILVWALPLGFAHLKCRISTRPNH